MSTDLIQRARELAASLDVAAGNSLGKQCNLNPTSFLLRSLADQLEEMKSELQLAQTELRAARKVCEAASLYVGGDDIDDHFYPRLVQALAAWRAAKGGEP